MANNECKSYNFANKFELFSSANIQINTTMKPDNNNDKWWWNHVSLN